MTKINMKLTSSIKIFLSTLTATAVFAVFGGAALAQNAGFSDVPRSHPHYVGITYLDQSDVISGYEDGTFKPQNPINRAEVLKIILNGSGIGGAEQFQAYFPDVGQEQWFAPFVVKAKDLGIVKGNESDGTFTPARQVNLAEFLKMLLATNQIDVSSFADKQLVNNVTPEMWFAPYVNYATAIGIVSPDQEGNLDAGRPLNRGEVANMMYLLNLLLKGQDTQFLLTRAEAEMAQIEVYIAANQIGLAKNASELAVDLTQQAIKNMPENNVVLGAGKIARAYDWVVDAFILGIQGQNEQAAEVANNAIDKATEAWEVNNATQPIARHIKDRAREILQQVGGEEE
jgi:hypothetical protein